jgi:hypothetical protein
VTQVRVSGVQLPADVLPRLGSSVVAHEAGLCVLRKRFQSLIERLSDQVLLLMSRRLESPLLRVPLVPWPLLRSDLSVLLDRLQLDRV